MAASEVAVPTLCSRCERSLDTNGSPRWCKACRAKYQREYQDLRQEMNESRGYAAGCSAMRDQASRYFYQWPHAMFSGAEVAAMILKLDDPGNTAIPRQG